MSNTTTKVNKAKENLNTTINTNVVLVRVLKQLEFLYYDDGSINNLITFAV